MGVRVAVPLPVRVAALPAELPLASRKMEGKRTASSNRIRANRTPLALETELSQIKLVDPVHDLPQVWRWR
jgi:hypothetical protein